MREQNVSPSGTAVFPRFYSAVLVLLAGASAILPVPLGIGLVAYFCSFFTILALTVGGFTMFLIAAFAAATVSAAAGAPLWLPIVLVAEALFVGLLFRLRDMDVISADIIFWVVFGAPLVFLIQSSMGVSGDHASVVTLAAGLNGLFNAALASAGYLGLVYAQDRGRPTFSIGTAISAALSTSVIIPIIILFAINIHSTSRSLVEKHETELESELERAEQEMMTYFANRREELAGFRNILYSDPDFRLDMMVSPVPSLASVAVVDDGGRIRTSNGALPETIADDLASQIRLGGEFGVCVLVDDERGVVAATAVRLEKGLLVGVLDIERMRRVVTVEEPYRLIIAEPGGNPLAGDMSHFDNLLGLHNNLAPAPYGLTVHTNAGQAAPSLLEPDTMIHTMGRTDPYGFIISVDVPAKGFREEYLHDMGLQLRSLAVIAVLGLLTVQLATRGLTRSLTRVTVAASNLGPRLTAGIGAFWPRSRLREVDRLSSMFELMEGDLARKYEAVEQVNRVLNIRVEEQTRKLRLTIQDLESEAAERGRAETATIEALNRADNERARLMSMINAMGDGVIIQDREYTVVYQNNAMRDMVGDVSGESATLILGETDMNPVDLPMAKAFDEQKTLRTMREIRTDKGARYMDITSSPVEDADGVVTSGVEIYRDITDQVQVLNELALSNDRFSVIMDALDSIVFVSDPETGDIVFANPSFTRLLGSPENMNETDVFESPTPDEKPVVLPDGTFTKGRTFERRITGGEWVIHHARGIHWTNGEPVILHIATNITDLKKAEAVVAEKSHELELANAELQQRMDAEIELRKNREVMLMQQSKLAAIGEMTGAIAHQWKQPLNALGIFVQSLNEAFEMGVLTGEFISETTEQSMAQITYMSETVNDFRSFIRGDRQVRDFDVIESVRSIFSLLSAQMKSSNIAIRLSCGKQELDNDVDARGVKDAMCGRKPACANDCSHDRLIVRGVENEFKQVMLNIVNNARDAIMAHPNEQHGQVRGSIEVTLTSATDVVLVTVTDTGGGVPEDAMDKLFSPDFTTKGVEGTGIGLQIARIIIEEKMAGAITVSNTEQGACFSISIPSVSPD